MSRISRFASPNSTKKNARKRKKKYEAADAIIHHNVDVMRGGMQQHVGKGEGTQGPGL